LRPIDWGGAVGLTVFLAGSPAVAQQAQPSAGFPLELGVPPPADTGKPRFFAPPVELSPPPGCAAALDCRLRVIGAVQHNGAVELNAALFKW
jgi:hypothetical protein